MTGAHELGPSQQLLDKEIDMTLRGRMGVDMTRPCGLLKGASLEQVIFKKNGEELRAWERTSRSRKRAGLGPSGEAGGRYGEPCLDETDTRAHGWRKSPVPW